LAVGDEIIFTISRGRHGSRPEQPLHPAGSRPVVLLCAPFLFDLLPNHVITMLPFKDLRFRPFATATIAAALLLGCTATAKPQPTDHQPSSRQRAATSQHTEAQPETQPSSRPDGGAESDDEDKDKDKKKEFKPKPDSITKHSIKIGERTLDYTATAGTVLLAEESGKERAYVFYIAYTLDDVEDVSRLIVGLAAPWRIRASTS
jgi:hypothetical protein